jgi:hypothetical protein
MYAMIILVVIYFSASHTCYCLLVHVCISPSTHAPCGAQHPASLEGTL